MAVTVQRYNALATKIADGTIQIGTTAIYTALMNSAHSVTSANSIWSQVSANQIADGNGYTAFTTVPAGRALSSESFTEAAGVATYDAGDTLWSATTGAIGPATDCVIVAGTTAGDLMFNVDFGEEKTADASATFKITWNGSGIFTIS